MKSGHTVDNQKVHGQENHSPERQYSKITTLFEEQGDPKSSKIFYEHQDGNTTLGHKRQDTSSQEYIEFEEEISEFSLVWVIYNEEATRTDASLAEGSNRGMDVLLVFTGLFSAVLTTFIIQSYQLLLPDDATVTNQLLAQMLALQLNSSLVPGYFTSAKIYPIANTTSSNARIFWVNGLWFAALSCSLSTALVSMLAKHWLQAYISDIHGSPRQQARERQFRFMKVEIWNLFTVINVLPLLLHVALLLFFAGLLIFIWTTSMGIVLPTFVIVGLVYIFYMISIWLSIFHPDSPFQHPISSHLRKERSLAPSSLSSSNAFSRNDFITDDGHQTSKLSMSCTLLRNGDEHPSSEHRIDACALIWLFGRSNGSETAAIALKSIAKFPRDFTAFNLLRDANAIAFVLRGFQMCFHRDTTAGINWNVKDSQAACIYCKSWLKLTRETTEKWPTDLWDPLEQLSRLEHNPDAAAIASCVLALASLDDHLAQWNLLSILGRFSRKEIHLSQSSQMWLLDALLECSLTWELPTAVLRETSHKAIPILLNIMHSSRLSKMSTITSVVGLCIHTLTGGILDLSLYKSEIRRREHYCELVVPALSIIVDNPSRFGIKDDTLQDYIGLELSRLVSLVFYQPMMFPDALRRAARTSISQLFLDGRLEVDSIDKDILADVLRLLFPPTAIFMQRRPAFTKTLLGTLSKSHHPGVNAWSVRLLEPLLANCSASVIQAFVEDNGVSILLRAANTGDIDSRRLQIDSLRTLCTYIKSCTALYFHGVDLQCCHTPINSKDTKMFDAIFQSDFFDILHHIITSRRWWLPEVTDEWVPSLLDLCRVRPQEPCWPTTELALRRFAADHETEDRCEQLLSQLNLMHILFTNGL